MAVELPPDLETLVHRLMTTGPYPTPGDVVRTALRLLEERQRIRAARLERLCRAIQRGLDSGPGSPLDIAEIKCVGRIRRTAP